MVAGVVGRMPDAVGACAPEEPDDTPYPLVVRLPQQPHAPGPESCETPPPIGWSPGTSGGEIEDVGGCREVCGDALGGLGSFHHAEAPVAGGLRRSRP